MREQLQYYWNVIFFALALFLLLAPIAQPVLYRYTACTYIMQAPASLCHRYLVSQNCVPPLCNLLTVMDAKILAVSMGALENILKLGKHECIQIGHNPYALMVEECGGKITTSC